MKQIWFLVLSAILATIGGVTWLTRSVSPPVESVVASALQSLQEQNRLSPFAARFVTIATSRKVQLGFSAEKTLIMPAIVTYEVDLSKVKQRDLAWDTATKTLSVTLPPIEVGRPAFDLSQVREYGEGAVLMTLTDAERALDQANREKAGKDVVAQARAPVMIGLAQQAAVRAITHSFALPLRAAGVDAQIKVAFRQ